MAALVEQAARVPDLGHVLDDDPVVGQGLTDGGDVRALRLEMRRPVRELVPEQGELLGPIPGVHSVVPEAGDEGSNHFGGVAPDPDRAYAASIDLLGIDVDLDDPEVVVGSPHVERILEPGADPDGDIGLAPQRVTDGEGHPEPVTRVDRPQTHPPSGDRSADQLGELDDRVAGVHGAATDDDQGPLGFGDDRGGPLELTVVDLDPSRDRCGDFSRCLLGPAVDRDLDGHGPGSARDQLGDRGLDDPGRLVRVPDQAGVLGHLAEHRGRIVDVVQDAESSSPRERRNRTDEAVGPGPTPVGTGQCRGRVEHARAGHDTERGR